MTAEAFVIEIRLKGEYRATGHDLTHRRGIVMRVAKNGLSGWGEFVEIPGYSRETVETALATLEGAPVTHANPHAVAARRAAELDLAARQQSVSLAEKLGTTPGMVPVGAVVARLGDLAGTLRESVDRLEEGYRKIKIKIGPGFDLEPLAALRRELPTVPLAADANGSYRPSEVPPEIDEFELLYLEQPYSPYNNWREFSALRAALTTPICLDESITGPPTLRTAIAAEACDVVTLKPARFAGLLNAVEMHDLAIAAGLKLVAGGMLETGIGRAGVAAFARLPGFSFPADLSASDRYWDRELTVPPWVLDDGRLTVPDRPGTGVEVDEGYLDEITVSHHSLSF